jgi:hypothetical protein
MRNIVICNLRALYVLKEYVGGGRRGNASNERCRSRRFRSSSNAALSYTQCAHETAKEEAQKSRVHPLQWILREGETLQNVIGCEIKTTVLLADGSGDSISAPQAKEPVTHFAFFGARSRDSNAVALAKGIIVR